jgi:hypothetical protein
MGVVAAERKSDGYVGEARAAIRQTPGRREIVSEARVKTGISDVVEWELLMAHWCSGSELMACGHKRGSREMTLT